MASFVFALLGTSMAVQEGHHPKILKRSDLGKQPAPLDAADGCITEYNVIARDGTRLTTAVILPRPCTGTYPVVMDRTPYGPTIDQLADFFVPSGYAAVLQNQRGCWTSSGDYDFWKKDAYDAYDTMEWITNQSWSNGDVFISGFSADGISALADFIIDNPYIGGAAATWATAYGHESSYWGGAYRYDLISHWLSTLNTCPNAKEIEQQVRENEAYNEWWAPIEANGPYGNHFPNVKAPGTQQAGWWDIFAGPQIESFKGVLEWCDPSVQDQQWLWVIPLGHCTDDVAIWGYPMFESLQSWPRFAVEMFDGNYSDPIFSYVKAYNVYVFGPAPNFDKDNDNRIGNYYTSFNDWPAYIEQRWYLGDNGVVSQKPPSSDTSFTYTYDPNNPAPASGANTLFSSTPCGPRDQTGLLSRSDVLFWQAAEPASEAFAIVGKVTATLTVSSTAVDTDFYVTLTDQYPNGGPLFPVRYGAIKMRWAQNASEPHNMVPGTQYTVTVDMWYTAYIWNPGHTLGVIITSSRSPEFSVNPNNGYPLYTQDEGPIIVANNTIFSTTVGSAYVSLPIVSIDDIPVNENIR